VKRQVKKIGLKYFFKQPLETGCLGEMSGMRDEGTGNRLTILGCLRLREAPKVDEPAKPGQSAK
jgi:hypothetical protein